NVTGVQTCALPIYKIIACDLDETLLSADTHVSVENREAIQKAVAHGVKFVPATGRGYVSVQNTLKEIGLEQAANEYVISFNGASITENKNNRVLYFDGLPNEIADRLRSEEHTSELQSRFDLVCRLLL